MNPSALPPPAWSELPEPFRSYLLLYRHGLFPMANTRGSDSFQWFLAPMRALIPLDERFHVPRRLAKTMRSGRLDVRIDTAFDATLGACAARRDTWINDEYETIYRGLHRFGIAHSVEAWREGTLVGGLYGLSMGGFFCGESMFSHERDASKVCLVALVEHLRRREFALLDAQIINDHTRQFGAYEIPHERFMSRLASALSLPRSFTPVPSTPAVTARDPAAT